MRLNQNTNMLSFSITCHYYRKRPLYIYIMTLIMQVLGPALGRGRGRPRAHVHTEPKHCFYGETYIDIFGLMRYL